MDLPSIPTNISSVVLSLNFDTPKEVIHHFMIDVAYWLKENPHGQNLVVYHDYEEVNLKALDFLKETFIELGLAIEPIVNPCLKFHGVESFQEHFLAMQEYFDTEATYVWLLGLSSPLMPEQQAILDGYQLQLQEKSCVLILADALVAKEEDLADHDWSDDDSEEGFPLYLTQTTDPIRSLTAITPETTVLGLAIDFDGCTDTIAARLRLSIYICNILAHYPQIKTIKLFIGSARQSLCLDFSNALTNGAKGRGDFQSCNILGEQFSQELRAQLIAMLGSAAPSVMFEPIMLCDVLNHLDFGTTYQHLSQDFNRNLGRVFLAFSVAEQWGGLSSVVLSNHLPGVQLLPNHWHLSYIGDQFFVSMSMLNNLVSIPIPSGLTNTLQELLTQHGVWLDGNWSKPVLLLNSNHAVCLEQLLDIFKRAATVEIKAENLNGVQVPLFRAAADCYDAADSVTMFDELKTSLFFLWAHWLGHDATQQCALLMLDDRDQDEQTKTGCLLGILDSLTHFYSHSGDLLPSNVRSQCVPFDARDAGNFVMPQAKAMIQGRGRLLSVEEYREILQEMARTIPPGSKPDAYKDALQRSVRALSVSDALSAGVRPPPGSVVDIGASTLTVPPSNDAVLGPINGQMLNIDRR